MGESNNPPSLHRYLYCYSNPTVNIDPDGNEPITLTAVAVYTAWAGVNSVIDTGLDYAAHKLLGEKGDFKGGKALATNFTVNMATGGVGGKISKLRKLGKVGKKALNYGAKVAGEVYRAKQEGLAWDEAVVSGVAGTVLGDVAGKAATKTLKAGKKALASKFANSSNALVNVAKKATNAIAENTARLTKEAKDGAAEYSQKLIGGLKELNEKIGNRGSIEISNPFAKKNRLQYLENGSYTNPGSLASKNLAGKGEDLYVGTYSKSKYWNKKSGLNDTHTPHHVVQDAVSDTTHGKGITINIKKEIHKDLATTGSPKRQLDNLRQHLAADVIELRNALRNAGYDRSTVNRQLQELIRQNKATGGFSK